MNILKLVKFHYRRAFRFALVGAIGTVEQLGIMYLLTERFGVWYIASALCGICFAVVSNYFLNFYWSFKDVIKYE